MTTQAILELSTQKQPLHKRTLSFEFKQRFRVIFNSKFTAVENRTESLQILIVIYLWIRYQVT